jgi:hypothetical protein
MSRWWVIVVAAGLVVGIVGLIGERSDATARLIGDAVAVSGASPRSPAVFDRQRPMQASGWCGATEVATGRPSIVGGAQVHLIYAYPNDEPDRFTEWAPKIVDDVTAVDAWWRSQDPGRAPRWALASFPGCNTRLGALDISSVQLPISGSQVAQSFLSGLPSNRNGVNLVYLDAGGRSSSLGQGICGEAFGNAPGSPGGSAFGNTAIVFLQNRNQTCPALAQTAAHELTHVLSDFFIGYNVPDACPGDSIHACGSDTDILNPHIAAPLSVATLNSSHNGYFTHVHNSPYLSHLDSPQVTLNISVSPPQAGTVQDQPAVGANPPSITCTDSCAISWDPGAFVTLFAAPKTGYAFRSWNNQACNSFSPCSFSMNASTSIATTFAPGIHVIAEGPGRIQGGGRICDVVCDLPASSRGTIRLTAKPLKGGAFQRWKGGCRGTNTTCTARVGKGHVTAVFSQSK